MRLAAARRRVLLLLVSEGSASAPWMPPVRCPYRYSCCLEGLVTSHSECRFMLQYLGHHMYSSSVHVCNPACQWCS